MAEDDIAVIIFIIFEFIVIRILNYLDFVETRKIFCEGKIRNKKCTKPCVVYKNTCKYAKKGRRK